MPRAPKIRPLKSSWTSSQGTMTFFLPQRGLYAVEATQIDHPITLCELADAANEKLTQVERQVLIELLARIDTKE